MRVLWLETKYPKSVFKPFFKLNPFSPISGLSNEAPSTPTAQETAKPPNVKVGGLKNNSAARPDLQYSSRPGFESWIFFRVSNFDLRQLGSPLSHNDAKHLIWKPHQGPIGVSIKKSVTAPLREFAVNYFETYLVFFVWFQYLSKTELLQGDWFLMIRPNLHQILNSQLLHCKGYKISS